MTKQDKQERLRRIDEQIHNIMMDCAHYRDELEEIGSKREADRLDTIAGKLYDLTCKLEQKF